MGHVEYLIDKCDYILIPRIACLNKHEKLCTNFNALYDLVRNTFKKRIVHYNIDVDKKDILFIGASTSINVNKEKDILNKHFNEYYIVNKDVNVSDLKLQSEEVSDAKWFDKEDILKRIDNNYEDITDKEGCWEYLKKYYEWKENNH